MLRDPVFFAPSSASAHSNAAAAAAGAESGRVSTPAWSRVRSVDDDTAVVETVYQDGFCHVWVLGDAGSKRSFQLRELACFTLQIQPGVRLRPRALHVCTAPAPMPIVDTLIASVLRARDERRHGTVSGGAFAADSATFSESSPAGEDLFAAYRPLAAVMLVPDAAAQAVGGSAGGAHDGAGSAGTPLAHDLGVCDVVLWSLPRQHAVHLLRFERAVTGIHSTPSLLLVATSSAIFGFSAHTLALAFRVDCGPQPFGDGFAAVALSESVRLSTQEHGMPACLLAYSPPAASVPALQLRAAAVASGLRTANDGADVSAGVTLHMHDAGDSDDGNSDSDGDGDGDVDGGGSKLGGVSAGTGAHAGAAGGKFAGSASSTAGATGATASLDDAVDVAAFEGAPITDTAAGNGILAAPQHAPDASGASARSLGARSLTEGSYGLAREAASLLRRLREAAVDLLASPPAALGVSGAADARRAAMESDVDAGSAARVQPSTSDNNNNGSGASAPAALPASSNAAGGSGVGLGLGDGTPCSAVAVCDVWQLIADFALWRASYDPSQQLLHPQSNPPPPPQAHSTAMDGPVEGSTLSPANGYQAAGDLLSAGVAPTGADSSALQQRAPPDFVPNAAIATVGAGRSVACITLQPVPPPGSALAVSQPAHHHPLHSGVTPRGGGAAAPATPAGAGAAATPSADTSAAGPAVRSHAAAHFVLAAANTLGQRVFCFDIAVQDSNASAEGRARHASSAVKDGADSIKRDVLAACRAEPGSQPAEISPTRYAAERAPFALRCAARCELERGITAARITRISVSAGGAWLSAVSDRGTAHVWPLMDAAELASAKPELNAHSSSRVAAAGAASALSTASVAASAGVLGGLASGPHLPPRGPSPAASSTAAAPAPAPASGAGAGAGAGRLARKSASGQGSGHAPSAVFVPRPLSGAVFAAGRVRLSDLLPAASAAALAAILSAGLAQTKGVGQRSPHLKAAAGPGTSTAGSGNRNSDGAPSVSSASSASAALSVAGVRGWAEALLRGSRSPFGAEGLIGYAVRTAREARRSRMLSEGTLSAAMAEGSAAAAEQRLHAPQTGLGSAEANHGDAHATGGSAAGGSSGGGRAGSGRRWSGDSSDEDDEHLLARPRPASSSAVAQARRSLRPLTTDGAVAARGTAAASSSLTAADSSAAASTAAAVAAAAAVAQLQAELHTQLCALAPVSWDGVLLGDAFLSVCRSGFIALTGLRARPIVHALDGHGPDAAAGAAGAAAAATESGSATRSGSSTHGARGSPLLTAFGLGLGAGASSGASAGGNSGYASAGARPGDTAQTGMGLLPAAGSASADAGGTLTSGYPLPSAPLAVPVPLSEGWIDLAAAGDVANLMLPGAYGSFPQAQIDVSLPAEQAPRTTGSAATASIAYAGPGGGHWGPADISWPSAEDLALPPAAVHSASRREVSRGSADAGADASTAAQGEGSADSQASADSAPSAGSTDSAGSATVLAAAAALLQPAAAAAGSYLVSVASAVGSAAASGASAVAARAAALPARLREGGVWDQVARGAAVTRDAASAAVGSAVAGVLGTLRPVVAGLSNPMHPDVIIVAKHIGSWDVRRQEHWPPVVALAAHWPHAMLQPLVGALALYQQQQQRTARASLADAPGRVSGMPAGSPGGAAASATLSWSRLDEALLPQLKLIPRYRRSGGHGAARNTATPSSVAVQQHVPIATPPPATAMLPLSPASDSASGSDSAAPAELQPQTANTEPTVGAGTEGASSIAAPAAAAGAAGDAGASAVSDGLPAVASGKPLAAPATAGEACAEALPSSTSFAASAAQDTSGFVSPPSETEAEVDSAAEAAAGAKSSVKALAPGASSRATDVATGPLPSASSSAVDSTPLLAAAAALDVDDAVAALLAQPLSSVRAPSSAAAVVDVPVVAETAAAALPAVGSEVGKDDAGTHATAGIDIGIAVQPQAATFASAKAGTASAADAALAGDSEDAGVVVAGQERLMALSALLESAHKQAAVAAAATSSLAGAAELAQSSAAGVNMSASLSKSAAMSMSVPGGMMAQSMSLLPGIGGGMGGLGTDGLFSPAASALFASCLHGDAAAFGDHHDSDLAGVGMGSAGGASTAGIEIPAPFLSARSTVIGTVGSGSASSSGGAADVSDAGSGTAAAAETNARPLAAGAAFTFEAAEVDAAPASTSSAAASSSPSPAEADATGVVLTPLRPVATLGYSVAASSSSGAGASAADHISSGSACSSSASSSSSAAASHGAGGSATRKSKRGKGGRR